MKRRILSIVMAIAMTISLMAVPAFAAEGDGDTGNTPSTETTYVAKIGDTKYATLQAAVNAAPTNGTATTITLLSDVALTEGTSVSAATKKLTIPAGSNVTLDLNEHTLTVGYRIEVKGDLTVQGGGTIVSAAAYLTAPYAVFYLYSSGTLALNNVTVNAKEEDGSTGFVLYVPATASASVSGGVLNGQIDANAGTLDITGGKFTADISPYLEAGQSAANDTDV